MISFLTRGLATGLLLISNTTHAETTISGFDFSSCGKKNCIKITAENAGVSFIGANYGLAENQIVISSKGSKRRQILNSKSAYIDNATNRIYIRDISKDPGHVALYDLVTEELLYFPN